MTPAIPRVLVTRAAEDAAALSHALSQAGMQPVEVPALLRQWDIETVVSLAECAGDADLLVRPQDGILRDREAVLELVGAGLPARAVWI